MPTRARTRKAQAALTSVTGAEREYETGKDEAHATILANGLIRSQDTYDKAERISLGVMDAMGAVMAQIAANMAQNCNTTHNQTITLRDLSFDAIVDPGPGEESLKAGDASVSRKGGKRR